MAKSALEKLKSMTQKDLIKKLGCPQDYELAGVYTRPDGSCGVQQGGTDEICKKCWTMKF